jgi:predicted ferric reductase
VLGLLRSLARTQRIRVSWLLDETHQVLAVATAAFVALHLFSLLFDPLIPFTPLNLLVPIAEPYRWFAVDLGVLALYGLAIVLGSSWLRRRIAHASWRALHYTSFAVFVLVTFHGILAGSDAGQAWMRVVYLGASGVVLLLGLGRVLWSPETGSTPAVATVAAPRPRQRRAARARRRSRA